MASSMRDLKKSRDAMFQALNKQIEDQNKKGGGRPEEDKRFWYPETDKAGNGYAVIRFLPAPPDEAVPYILEYSHGFKGPGGWYIERSLTTMGRGTKDPVSEYNMQRWQESLAPENAHRKEDLQNGCKQRKRNTGYIANILVVTDTAHPENEGEVFLYRYGLKIHGMIEEKMKPSFPGEKPINPFDPWDGADLKLKITTNKPVGNQKKGFRNYDKSEFAAPAPIGSDDEIENIWKKEYPLQPIIAPDTFKSYADLEKSFSRAMGFDKQRAQESLAEEPSAPPARTPRTKNVVEQVDETPPWNTGSDASADSGDDDDDLAKFRAMAGMGDND
jgi:hypothetical protein